MRDVYVEGLEPAPQIELQIDREKAAALGVAFEDINNTISTNLGSTYINDFPNRSRMQRVIVQADRAARMQVDHILAYNVRNARGQLVPMTSFATVNWAMGPTQIVGLQLLSVGPHLRLREAGLHQRRRHSRDGTTCVPTSAGLRLRVDRPVAAGEVVRLAGSVPARAYRCYWYFWCWRHSTKAGPFRWPCC